MNKFSLNKYQIDNVFKNVKIKINSNCFTILINKRNINENIAIACIVAKKKEKLAVRRNLIRRICREYIRNHKEQLDKYHIVLIAKVQIKKADKKAIWKSLEKLSQVFA